MDLCRDCLEFATAISKRSKSWLRPHGFWNAARLRSGFCPLCKMISDYILDNADEPKSTIDEYVKLSYWSFEGTAAHGPLSCVLLTTKSGLRVEMNVWSDPRSPAALSGAVCDQPPSQSDNCSVAFVHINSWIQDCLMNHKKCQYTISGNLVDEIHGSRLPTRVLDLGCADNTADLSLIETQHERGNYCALSYCWGPPGMNHLLTTRENLKSHFEGIMFEQLPKTLQDAVIVTRQIGIRYLWIDSLCIIQDDKADWTMESARMGAVYQNAYLVIAASGAAHPGEGCFSNIRRCATSAEIPHFSKAGQRMGSIRLSISVPGDESPFWGPLQERGWAMQEWRLARRTLHFMPVGISWKCRELESGERYPYDMLQHSDWGSVLQNYSDCQLTYKEDRLVALEGLGKAYQEADGDEYTFGILKSQLPELLLWAERGDDSFDKSGDLISVPTWSWAAKGGSKVLWSTQNFLGQSMINNAELAIEKSGVMRIKGVLQECKVSNTIIDEDGLADLHPKIHFIWRRRKTLYLFERTSASSLMGIAAFDREYFETVNVLFLNKLQRNDETRPQQIAYAALLLVPNADLANSFRRVGMGFLSSSLDVDNLSLAFRVASII